MKVELLRCSWNGEAGLLTTYKLTYPDHLHSAVVMSGVLRSKVVVTAEHTSAILGSTRTLVVTTPDLEGDVGRALNRGVPSTDLRTGLGQLLALVSEGPDLVKSGELHSPCGKHPPKRLKYSRVHYHTPRGERWVPLTELDRESDF